MSATQFQLLGGMMFVVGLAHLIWFSVFAWSPPYLVASAGLTACGVYIMKKAPAWLPY